MRREQIPYNNVHRDKATLLCSQGLWELQYTMNVKIALLLCCEKKIIFRDFGLNEGYRAIVFKPQVEVIDSNTKPLSLAFLLTT